MFLNTNLFLNCSWDNFHVPECLCDEDAPTNKNYLNATDYSRISVFLNWMYLLLNTKLLRNVPRYQTTFMILNVNVTCSWIFLYINTTSMFQNVYVMKMLLQIKKVTWMLLIVPESLCSWIECIFNVSECKAVSECS